jgi:type II secretory pathway pseudopilin PulG
MGAVGKILVFINLVFSLIVAALIVTVYMSQTRWAAELKKSEANNQVLVASNQAFQEENQRVAAAASAQVAEVNARLKKAEDERDYQAGLAKEKDAQIQQMKTRGNSSEALTTAAQVESTRRQADTEKLRETLKKETDENARLTNETNKMRERAVAAEIQFRAASERADRMEKEMQRLAQDNARLKANVGGSAVARRGGTERNPPPENVEGLIKAYDPASGLVTITIGTDAGVTKGNTMEVFRLASVPSQSKYLGTIRIVEAGHNYAVGQPVGRMLAPPQVGDRVASRILGS